MDSQQYQQIIPVDTNKFQNKLNFWDNNSDETLQTMQDLIKFCNKQLINPQYIFKNSCYKQMLKIQSKNSDKVKVKTSKIIKYNAKNVNIIDFSKFKKYHDSEIIFQIEDEKTERYLQSLEDQKVKKEEQKFDSFNLKIYRDDVIHIQQNQYYIEQQQNKQILSEIYEKFYILSNYDQRYGECLDQKNLKIFLNRPIQLDNLHQFLIGQIEKCSHFLQVNMFFTSFEDQKKVQNNFTSQQYLEFQVFFQNLIIKLKENEIQLIEKIKKLQFDKNLIDQLQQIIWNIKLILEDENEFNKKDICKFNKHINFKEFQKLKSEQFMNQFISTISDLIQLYTDEQKIITISQQSFKNSDYLPCEIKLLNQKIQNLNQFFVKQLNELYKLIQSNEMNKIDNLFLIFLFIKEIQWEIILFEKKLPSYSTKSVIQKKMYENTPSSVYLLMGSTGSGKTTQIPQILFALNNYCQKKILKNSENIQSKILCVQPRRIACATLYKRMKFEMKEYSNHVGYYLGNMPDQQNYKNASIIFATEQVFINIFVSFLKGENKQSLISQCSHIIIDEVHERNLKTDIIIGLINRYLSDQNQVKSKIQFLFSSATINEEIFQRYFHHIGIDIIEIKGHSYPVDVKYIDNSEKNIPIKTLILNQIEKIIETNKSNQAMQEEQEGHILIFLQDQIQINSLIEEAKQLAQLNSNFLKRYQILQLHGKLNPKEQQKVFEENEYETKIIFSTNIAEASITIENVSIVIDTGLEKTMIFDPNRNSNVATIQNISKSQADQRKGRAGRTRSGVCYRLYTEQQYKEFKQDKEPEILRSNLGFAILKIIELGVQNVTEFKFLSQPSNNLINNSLETLQTLNAIKINNGLCELTQIGQCIIQTQLEPIIARILIKAYQLQVLDQVIKVLCVYAEYNSIFSNFQNSKNLLRQIFQTLDNQQQIYTKKSDILHSQLSDPSQSKNQQNQIDEKNSDFLFMWRTYEYLENQIQNQMNIKQKRDKLNFINNAYKKISEYYKDLKNSFEGLRKYIKKIRFYKCDEELIGIKNQMKNEKNNVAQINQQQLSIQEIKTNIVHSFFIGFSKQIAVYTGIHKLGFSNIQSNVMFYVHPSSPLNTGVNLNNEQKCRLFSKGDAVFFSILEEREINNFAKCVSFFDPSWIKDIDLKQQLEIKSNFEPHIILNGEKSLLEYFFRNEFFSISQKLLNYNRNDNSKKAKYFINFDKDYGKFQLYCNEEMKDYVNSLNIQLVFEESKQQFQKNQKKEQGLVRYKDSFNFAIVKSGLQIKQIILPHQFLQVNIVNIPFKCKDSLIQKSLQSLQNENLFNKCQDIKINDNYVEKTSYASLRFKNTQNAFFFYSSLLSTDMDKFANLLHSQKIPQIIPVPECNFYMESIKNLSKCIVRAQWSISPSLCMGQIYFNNEVDALATYDQLKAAKQFKVRFDEKQDRISQSKIFIIQIDKLHNKFDEVDLDAYIVNGYSGFMSAQIQRQQMDSSFYRNISIEECIQKQKLITFITDSNDQNKDLKRSNIQNSSNSPENKSESLQVWIKIQKGVCKAEITLDSEVQAKEIVDKFNGQEFGYQKLRLQIQNFQKIPILGAVYKFYYQDIKQFISEADQVVHAKSPELSQVILNSKNIYLTIKQVKQNGNIIFSRLQFQIKNIIKPDLIYLDCNPEDLEKVMEIQFKIIQSLEKKYNCVLLQQSKRKSVVRVWFKKDSTSKYIQDSKKQIKNVLNEHLKQKFHIMKVNYQFKIVDSYLSALKKSKEIDYDYDNKKITITATKNIINKVKQELNNPANNYLLSSNKQEENTCQICQEIKNLERFLCDCLFCKECIYQFFLTQSQDKQNDKPLACPNHQNQTVSLKIINSVFDQQQITEIVQIRIDNSIENLLHPITNKQAYIRCPSVNCNEFFERIYQESNQHPQELEDEIEVEETQKKQSIKKNTLVSKKLTKHQIPPPKTVKCYGCFQEFCLLQSGNTQEKIEYQIHQTHVQKKCEEFFKDLELEQENIKGIHIIQCPKCNIKATKGGGCNHIACRCGAHFCAKCLEQFFSARDVYNHLQEKHQGIFD